MIWAGLGAMAQVYVAFAIAVVMVPLWLVAWPKTTPPLTRLLGSVALGSGFWILVGYGLALMHSITFVSLMAIGIGASALLRVLQKPPEPVVEDVSSPTAPASVKVLDIFDPHSRYGLGSLFLSAIRALGRTIRRLTATLKDPVVSLSVLAFLGVGVLVLREPLLQVAPGSALGYQELLAIKDLSTNAGLFTDGLFPEGLHLLAAILSTGFFLDALNVLRFLGPLAAILMVLAEVGFTYELSGSRLATLVVLVATGLTNLPALGLFGWHLTTPAPLKFAAALFPVALLFSVRYQRSGQVRELLAASIATLVMTAVQPEPGLLMVVAIWLWYLTQSVTQSVGHPRLAIKGPLGITAGGALGALPIGIGWIVGLRPLASIWWGGLLPLPPTLPWHIWIPTHIDVLAAAVFGISLMGLTLLYHLRRQDTAIPGLAPIVLVFLIVLAFPSLVPGLWPILATGGMAALLAIPLLGWWLFKGALGPIENRRGAILLALMIAASGVFGFPHRPTPLRHLAPRGSGQAYLRIASQFLPYQWTIVSPVAQYSEVLGKGWHFELVDFVRDYHLSQARNPHFFLKNDTPHPVLTPDVFLFLEPRPLGKPLNAADLALPLGSGNNAYQGQHLLAVEARAVRWGLAYIKSHPQTAQIYFDNRQFMVIWIHQPS